MGYLVIGLFLLVNGLFLWVFKGGYNIPDSGFASLEPFFSLAPWVFLFLIPAITMKSFSEEIRQGTIELLLTRPLTSWQLILGKYFGALVLVVFSLLPTLLYVMAVSELSRDEGSVDSGVIIGSYFGLLFLGGCYAAIGVFASLLSPNQIVSFIVGVFLCFIAYFGFQAMAELNVLGDLGNSLAEFGISAHYKSISRGVIDTRDLIYFLSMITFFLVLTKWSLTSKKAA